MFQYEVLNNNLYLNKSLYKMKLADTPLCTFCQREEETINHLFLECEYSETHWNEAGGRSTQYKLPECGPWICGKVLFVAAV